MKYMNQFAALVKRRELLPLGKVAIGLGIFILSNHVWAGDTSNDLLAGTTTQALETINGTGRYWAYIIDGAISLAAFAKTKNPFVFASVLAVALGITVIVVKPHL